MIGSYRSGRPRALSGDVPAPDGDVAIRAWNARSAALVTAKLNLSCQGLQDLPGRRSTDGNVEDGRSWHQVVEVPPLALVVDEPLGVHGLE